jgi:hypothetical protein
VRQPLGRAIDRALDALPERIEHRFALLTGGAAFLALVIVSSTAWHLVGAADDARRADIGRALAGQLASLSIEPLFVDDRILLGVLATKMADVDAVENVSILTIDERVIAEAGDPASAGAPVFTSDIVLDGDLAGYARLTLDPRAFGTATSDLVTWLVVALAAFGLCTTVGYAAGKRLVERRARLLEAARAAAANDERPREPTARYFLVINLFNQLSMPSAKRHVVIAACAERLGAIGDLYHGRCDTLPGTGLVMRFDDVPPADTGSAEPESLEARAFDAVCAALLAVDVVGELVAEPPVENLPTLDFRFAVHVLALPADAHRERDAINDTVLLSAVAPSREIAASHDLIARLDGCDRFGTRTQDHTVLHALVTARKGSCVLIDGAEDALRSELDGQVDKLICATPSTSSPSTF